METELSTLRSQSRAPAQDPLALRQRMVQDPFGYYQSLGMSPAEIEHMQRVHVAQAMGDKAPPELRTLVQLGSQVSTTSALSSTVEALSRRLDEQEREKQSQAARSSFKTLIADASKYPHLSKAYAANPALFDSRVDGKGNVEELAKTIETEQASLAAVYGYKAPAQAASANAGTQQSQSAQAQPASVAGTISGDPPPIPQAKAGIWTPDEHAKLRDEVLRKYANK